MGASPARRNCWPPCLLQFRLHRAIRIPLLMTHGRSVPHTCSAANRNAPQDRNPYLALQAALTAARRSLTCPGSVHSCRSIPLAQRETDATKDGEKQRATKKRRWGRAGWSSRSSGSGPAACQSSSASQRSPRTATCRRHRRQKFRNPRWSCTCSNAFRLASSARRTTRTRTARCCIAHFLVALGSHWAGGRLPPERKDPGQARIHIDALT